MQALQPLVTTILSKARPLALGWIMRRASQNGCIEETYGWYSKIIYIYRYNWMIVGWMIRIGRYTKPTCMVTFTINIREIVPICLDIGQVVGDHSSTAVCCLRLTMRPSLKRRAGKQRPVGCYLRNQLRVPYAVPHLWLGIASEQLERTIEITELVPGGDVWRKNCRRFGAKLKTSNCPNERTPLELYVSWCFSHAGPLSTVQIDIYWGNVLSILGIWRAGLTRKAQ